jgi:hypothetical protein
MRFYEELGWQSSHTRFYRGHDMTVMVRDLIVHPPLSEESPVATSSQKATPIVQKSRKIM